jgi:S-formylglutathione hydrolase FrmB
LSRKELSPKPSFYVTCGDEDALLQDNLRFVETLRETHDVIYDQHPGGHTWKFWDKALKRVLRWLPL